MAVTEDTYTASVKTWAAMCSGINYIPLEDISKALEIALRFETIGPFVEPTRFMRGGSRNIRQQIEFLKALLAFRRSLEGVKEIK